MSAQMLSKIVTVCVWSAVAFSAVGWALRDSPAGGAVLSNASVTPGVVSEPSSGVNTQAVAHALGAQTPSPLASASSDSRFQLLGVLNSDANLGVALIAQDGKPAKPYRVGQTVAEGWVVQRTSAKQVSLGSSVDGPTTLTLDLPAKR